jgi:hypothetical protein
MGGTAQQYHDTDLTGYDTDLNTRGGTELNQRILKLGKKGGFSIKPL